MRNAFAKKLFQLAKKNKDIFLLTGDLGFSVFEKFQKSFPKRFFNAGVAEQNMLGVAAGLALSGKTVFVYSIIPFVTMRCLEQIRNDICMQDLDVKIIGVGAGLNYGPAGPTHHAIEDISIMRSLPNMMVVSPASPREAALALEASLCYKKPVYIRLSKSIGPIEISEGSFQMGKAITLSSGGNITIITTGSILYNAKEIVADLKKEGIQVRLINMHTVKPIDKNAILKAAKQTKAIFTIEESNIIGGLGSAVSEVLAESKYKVRFKCFALPDSYVKRVGDRKYLLQKNGLSNSRIIRDILRIYEQEKNAG